MGCPPNSTKGALHMKIVVSKQNLLNGVQIVSKAVPNKTTMTILECILIDTTSGKIKLTANDTELGIETVIDGEIIEKGMKRLSSIFEGRFIPCGDDFGADHFKKVMTAEKYTDIWKQEEDAAEKYLHILDKKYSV